VSTEIVRAKALLLWRKQHWADIVRLAEDPFTNGRKSMVRIVPTEGVWFDTETRFLFEYDLTVIKPYLSLLRRMYKTGGVDSDLLPKALLEYSRLDRWWKQIADASTQRNLLFVLHGRIHGNNRASHMAWEAGDLKVERS
jgi:hypothetical protein